MSDNSQVIKMALAGVGAIAVGALVWYLSKDESLDYKKFSK